ncbi:MAG: YbaK/EbsC family protein [Coriobacteriia bacterium]|nr:YbaK/EbsC family protein [Coriobacteriia bacterium]
MADASGGPRRRGSAERVRASLADHGLADAIIRFEQSTKTAKDAADAMGCELGQIVKSLVFVVDDTPVLALVAGDRRGDSDAIAREVGGVKADLADADAVRAATGYAIGGVSPFDLPDDLAVLLDDSLLRYDIVYPAAGTPSSMVRMTLEDLCAMTLGRMARISH